MTDSNNEDLDVTAYPFLRYKEWDFFPFPSLVKDTEKHLQRIKDFSSRDNDILLCTAPKVGNHWIFEIISMLIDQTTEYNSRRYTFSVHLEYPPDFGHLEKEQRQRLMQTCLPLSLLPDRHIQKKAKIVYMNRNPKDRYVSMFHFIKGLNGAPNFTWDEFFEKEVLNDKLLGGWFNHTKEMEAAVNNPSINIHRVLYEELYLNPEDEVKRLAEYLEVPFDVDFIKNIADKCSFDKLKKQQFDGTKAMHPEKKSTIFRKGVIGDWKNWFTVAQNEQFNELYSRQMEGVNVKFIYEYPDK